MGKLTVVSEKINGKKNNRARAFEKKENKIYYPIKQPMRHVTNFWAAIEELRKVMLGRKI